MASYVPCTNNHSTYYEDSKQWSGAGVIIVENYYPKDGTPRIPCILVGRDIGRGKYTDFGGHYESQHNNLQTTSHHELREESCNLFNISPSTLQQLPYSDSKYKDHYYRTYFVKIRGVSRKMYHKNRLKLIANRARRCWLETDNIIHVPIENIPIESLLFDGDIITTDIDGQEVVLHNRLRQCLLYGYGKMLEVFERESIANSRTDGRTNRTRDFLNGTFSIVK
jgi:hypothetical protein